MNNFINTLQYFLLITAELTVLFLVISTLVSLLLMHVSDEKLNGWLSKKGLWGNTLAAVVGALTPFCACSTIPMTVGLLKAGAPFGSVMSFIIASPLLNPIILTMVATLMGLKACLLYFTITFLGSILFGALLAYLGGAKYVKKVRLKKKTNASLPHIKSYTFPKKLQVAFFDSLSDFRSIVGYLLIGVAIGAVVYGYIPQEFIVEVAGPDNPFAIPIAAIVGVPLYIRAETAIPIGLALSQKGMSMGAVIALIIGGAGMAIPEMSMLASIFHKRIVAAISFIVFITAVIGGYVFNSII